MSYVYFLVRLKKPPISSLRELKDDVVDDWDFTVDDLRNKLSELYPSTKWEWREVRYEVGPMSVLRGQVRGAASRFEFAIETWPFYRLRIDGSYNVDQTQEIIELAKRLGLSVIDMQTGERIYLQDK